VPVKPEIMSPAGYWPQMRTAIEAGADAIYFGLRQFTARAKVGFTLDELPEAVKLMHGRGVRGYLTFNTLVFDNELRDAVRALEKIAESGVDAVIVQDVGIARLVNQIAPDLEVHGSTQMSITSAEGVEYARRFGVSRVVLARELSLAEIAQIRAQTDLELEMFVHGALCVSYSGQCFSSEAWGGRSANRGQCAQACRLPYDMIVDGVHRPLDDARYLLSPGDLSALDEIPRIVALGISSLKIEGRYKDSDYVALTTAAYRKAVDDAWAGTPARTTARDKLMLEQVYSRGLGPWFVAGTNHQVVVHGRAPRHRGVDMGRVTRVDADSVTIKPSGAHAIAPLKPGDGVVFDAANWRSPEQREEGGRVYQVTARRDGQLTLHFANGALDFARIRAGDWLWRSDDVDVARAAKPFADAQTPVSTQPVRMQVVARVGEPMRLRLTLHKRPDVWVEATTPEPLAAARNQGLSVSALHEQLGKLGGTPYALAADADALMAEIDGNPFAPIGLLNQLRRDAVAKLASAQIARPARAIQPGAAVLEAALPARLPAGGSPATCRLHVLVRTPEQLDAALALRERPASITLDYLELYGLRPAVERIQAAGIAARVASPRVLKPNEERVVNFLRTLGCGVLARSSGLLHSFAQTPDAPTLTGDFSLNAANALSAAAYLDSGLERLTPTYDLNAAQIAALTARVDASRLEVVAYMHLPVFHTEHCVFCRYLSNGTSYKDCGHPCEKHRVALRDINGRAHPVMADVGCRNTVFGAEAQEISAHLDALRVAGIRHFRVEFVHESATQVGAIAAAFQDALADRISARTLGECVAKAAPQGVTEGSFFVPVRTNL
jgi:putative protease